MLITCYENITVKYKQHEEHHVSKEFNVMNKNNMETIQIKIFCQLELYSYLRCDLK